GEWPVGRVAGQPGGLSLCSTSHIWTLRRREGEGQDLHRARLPYQSRAQKEGRWCILNCPREIQKWKSQLKRKGYMTTSGMLVPLFSLSLWLVPQLARSQAVSANLLGKITDTSGAV